MATKKKEPKPMTYFGMLLRWNITFKKLSNEDAGRIIKAAYTYVLENIETDFSDNAVLEVLWSDVAAWLNTSCEKFEKQRKDASIAGSISAENRKRLKEENDKLKKELEKQHSLTPVNECQENQSNPNQSNPNQNKAKSLSLSSSSSSTEKQYPFDVDLRNLKEYFKNHIAPIRHPEEYNKLGELLSAYGFTFVKQCIDIGKQKGANSVAYVEKICVSEARREHGLSD